MGIRFQSGLVIVQVAALPIAAPGNLGLILRFENALWLSDGTAWNRIGGGLTRGKAAALPFTTW